MSITFTPARWLAKRGQDQWSASSSGRTGAEKTLLELVRIDAGARQPSVSGDVIWDIDWAYLLELAYREGLAPLVYHAITQAQFGVGSEVQARKFYYLYHLTRRRNARAYGQLREVLLGLRAAGIEAIVLKGAALAAEVYQDSGLRPFADMDILVRRRDLQRAHDILRDLGYRLNYQGNSITAPGGADLKYRSARQYYHEGGDYLSIDLYWQLGRYPYIVPIDHEGFWERASKVTLEGVPALVLSPEDAMLHLSLDFILGVWYGHPELKSLRDIAEIACRQEVDWEALASRASRSALAPSLYYSGRLAREMLGAAVPEETLARIYPGASWWKGWALRRLEKRIFGGGHPLKYPLLAILMRLAGPEGYGDKSKWLARLLIPPKGLWSGIPGGLGRVLLGKTAQASKGM